MTILGYLILASAVVLFILVSFWCLSRKKRANIAATDHSSNEITLDPSKISVAAADSLNLEEDQQTASESENLGLVVKQTNLNPEPSQDSFLDDLQDASVLAELLRTPATVPRSLDNPETDFEGAPVKAEAISATINQKEILGSEVVEQIEEIDQRMDNLATLVASIEESLAQFTFDDEDDWEIDESNQNGSDSALESAGFASAAA